MAQAAPPRGPLNGPGPRAAPCATKHRSATWDTGRGTGDGAARRTAVERALEAEDGLRLVAELRAAFEADLDAQLRAAAAAVEAGDPDALARAAHRIKGGAAAVGEHGLERAAAALEAAAKARRPAGPALRALCEAVG